jgi:L-alanine-DL-glutamate epimerase-like enolase superfamily enzyme
VGTIESATVRVIARPCDPPFTIDWATIHETSYIVCEVSADGETGMGYSFFFDSRHGVPAAELTATLLDQIIAGGGALGPAEVAARLRTILAFTGYPGIGVSCASAIEMAYWDLWSKREGVVWTERAGLAEGRSYPGYVTCGSTSASPAEVAADVEDAMGRGYSMVKIKVGADHARDEQRLLAARKEGGDELEILIDANQTWDLKTAMRNLQRWSSEIGLFWIEEPLPFEDIENLKRLRDATDVPVATGESFYGVAQLMRIVEARAADVLTVNPQKVGGIVTFGELAAACNLTGTAMTCHTFGEVAAQLLAGVRDVPGIEVVPWMLGAFEDAPIVRDGRVHSTREPGLGVTLTPEAEQWTTVVREVRDGKVIR